MTSRTLTCDHPLSESAEAYALGALDAAETPAFEAHLRTCQSCRQRVRELQTAASLLPHALAAAPRESSDAVADATLPPALKARVLDAIRHEDAPQVVPTPSPTLVPVAMPAAALAAASATVPVAAPGLVPADVPREPIPLRRAGGSATSLLRRRPWRWLGGAAAAAVIVLSLGLSLQLGTALARERQLRQDLALELAALAGQQEVVLEVVDGRDRTVRLLRPAPGAPPQYTTSYGKVYTRPDLPHVVAMTGRLPTPPPGQGYFLWVRLGGQTLPAGQLTANVQGFGQLVFDADRNGPAYESAWLTLQPLAGGQPSAPQGPTILRWDTPTT